MAVVMERVRDLSIEVTKLSACGQSTSVAATEIDLAQAVDLISELAAVACEHESSIDLRSWTNYLDLYRTYLENHALADSAGESVVVACFGGFVRDTKLLALAAAQASAESGCKVPAPSAL